MVFIFFKIEPVEALVFLLGKLCIIHSSVILIQVNCFKTFLLLEYNCESETLVRILSAFRWAFFSLKLLQI